MPRLAKAVPKYRKHSSGNARVSINGRDYLSHCRSYYGTKVTSEYHRILPAIKPLRKLYADYDADQIGPVQYKVVRQSMIEVGLSRQGINSRMKKIVRMFKWAASEGKLPAAVFETL